MANALSGTNPISLSGSSISGGGLDVAVGSTLDAPTIFLNNWLVNTSMGDSDNIAQAFYDGMDQNPQNVNGNLVLEVPGHGRIIFEYNELVNFNPTGMWFGWDIAGMGKSFGAVQNEYIYNTFDGGAGLGDWLDTDNIDNRLEGNLFINVTAAALNVEASPGPNLMANNIVESAPGNNGGTLASWSSDRDWAINNTLVSGEGFYGSVSLNTGEDGQRMSPWNNPSLPWGTSTSVWDEEEDAQQAYVNNLFLSISTAIGPDTNPFTPDMVAGNYTDNAADPSANPWYQVGQSATSDYVPDSLMALADPGEGNYGLTASSELNDLGYSGSVTDVSGTINLAGVDVTTNTINLPTANPQYVTAGNFVFFQGSVPTGITVGHVYQILTCTNSTSFTLQDPNNPGTPVSITAGSGGNFSIGIVQDSLLAPGTTSGVINLTPGNIAAYVDLITLPGSQPAGQVVSGNLIQFSGNVSDYDNNDNIQTGYNYVIGTVVQANQSFTFYDPKTGQTMYMNQNAAGRSFSVEFSTDGGKTWSTPRRAGPHGCRLRPGRYSSPISEQRDH